MPGSNRGSCTSGRTRTSNVCDVLFATGPITLTCAGKNHALVRGRPHLNWCAYRQLGNRRLRIGCVHLHIRTAKCQNWRRRRNVRTFVHQQRTDHSRPENGATTIVSSRFSCAAISAACAAQRSPAPSAGRHPCSVVASTPVLRRPGRRPPLPRGPSGRPRRGLLRRNRVWLLRAQPRLVRRELLRRLRRCLVAGDGADRRLTHVSRWTRLQRSQLGLGRGERVLGALDVRWSSVLESTEGSVRLIHLRLGCRDVLRSCALLHQRRCAWAEVTTASRARASCSVSGPGRAPPAYPPPARALRPAQRRAAGCPPSAAQGSPAGLPRPLQPAPAAPGWALPSAHPPVPAPPAATRESPEAPPRQRAI